MSKEIMVPHLIRIPINSYHELPAAFGGAVEHAKNIQNAYVHDWRGTVKLLHVEFQQGYRGELDAVFEVMIPKDLLDTIAEDNK